ncbi:cytochrome P450, partial [Leptodontidium sp. MPI-SDFR-AT-0119]
AYHIFFHPLAKYPGPWIAKLTNGYAAYHAWIGDVHLDMHKCHQKYGKRPYVRYAPDRLLFNTAGGLQDIYGHRTKVQKSKVYNAIVHRAPNTLTLLDRKQHSRRRRVISQAFSDSHIASVEPAILKQIWKFVDIISNHTGGSPEKEGWSHPINISKWCDYLTFDIMASVVFSGEYNMLGNADNRYVLDSIVASNVRMGVLLQAPEMASWKIHKRLFPAAIAARDKFIPFISRMVGDRLKLEKSSPDKIHNDVFSFLAKAKDPETGEGLTLSELGAESTTLIVAGSDTTSTTIAGTFYYFTRYPSFYKQARDEVRAAFGSAEEIRLGPQLNQCVFLRACINETLRISPSVGSALWREVQAGGETIDGHFFPPGVDVGVGIYSIHHNDLYHSNPLVYSPGRWLQSTTQCEENSKGSAQDAFCPFSKGPRSCVGKGVAMVELMLTFACVLWALDLKSSAGETDGTSVPEFRLRDHVTSAKDGPLVQFRSR